MPRVTSYALILIALSACSGGGGQEQAASERDPVTSSPVTESATHFRIEYGRHYPNGKAAVDYLIGPEGMWKEITSLEYVWNYYSQCARPGRPYDRQALIRTADGTRMFTAPDANCNLLLDADGDGEVDALTRAHAFHEHNGRGMHGQPLATPFTNFWFDDNWLAKLVTDVYGYPAPDGLRENASSVRWRVLSGEGSSEPLYGDVQFDRLALDGLRYLSRGDVSQALAQWTQIRDRSGYFHDGTARDFAYPLIDENYHLGLFEILTAVLMSQPQVPSDTRAELLQHWVAVRANLLNNQERNGAAMLGWRSSIGDGGSLMNTETISIDTLALGADALEVFEAGHAPLGMDEQGFAVGEAFVSARVGTATAGNVVAGPNNAYPAGAYQVQFVLRSPGGGGRVARLEARDARTDRVLASQEVASNALAAGQWSSPTLQFELADSATPVSFRTYWYGEQDMDIAVVRLRRSGGPTAQSTAGPN